MDDGGGGDENQQDVHLVGQPNNTRVVDPFNIERVSQILREVSIGEDLSTEQRTEVTNLITEYADVFAHSLSEMLPVDFMTHKLNVDPSVPLPTKVNQKPLTAEQKPWYYSKIDEMEAAGIITRVRADEVRCLAPTTL
ncbi:hypothetical protein M422DRAFT_173999, partial [Sphaerobolus stellatus SS14]